MEAFKELLALAIAIGAVIGMIWGLLKLAYRFGRLEASVVTKDDCTQARGDMEEGVDSLNVTVARLGEQNKTLFANVSKFENLVDKRLGQMIKSFTDTITRNGG